MDYLEKTRELLGRSDKSKLKIAADCDVSMKFVYALTRADADPTHSRLKRVYEYLSGRKMEV